jgi:hypothetical protein
MRAHLMNVGGERTEGTNEKFVTDTAASFVCRFLHCRLHCIRVFSQHFQLYIHGDEKKCPTNKATFLCWLLHAAVFSPQMLLYQQ